MHTFRHAFTRTLAFLAVATLAGCDDPYSPLDDGDDLELRTYIGAGVPPVVPLTKRPPLYPVEKIDNGGDVFPSSDPWIHSGYDPVSGATIDVAGYTSYTFDQNELLPYGTSDVGDFEAACDAFKLKHAGVPISGTGSLQYCADEEDGCCDYVCKVWGGVAPLQNRVTFVDESVMLLPQIFKTYVPQFLAWSFQDPNHLGGLGRAKACACNCIDPE